MGEIERGPLLYIKWEDPTSMAQWMDAADVSNFLTDKTFIAESVGWLVAEDEEGIVIAATINEPDSYVGQAFRIPKNAIHTRKILRKR